MSHIPAMSARDMMSKGLTGPLFSPTPTPTPSNEGKSWSNYFGLSRKSSKKEKKVTPNEEYDNNDDISPRDSDLGLDVAKQYNVTTSLHDMKALPLFFEGEEVYFLNNKEYLKGTIISQNEDNKYIIQPVNSSMPIVEIDEKNITTDKFKRKGGKTFKSNRKNNKRKTRRHKKTNKKHKKAKKQTKRRK
jgi:hypothetical protein